MFKKILNIFSIIIIFCACTHQLHHIIDLDEGVILNGAWKMYNGEKIYKDFFEYVAPLSFYLVYFIFKIFGDSYYFVKFFLFLLLFVSTVFMYKTAQNLLKNGNYSLFVSAIYLLLISPCPLINHNTLSSISTVAVMYLFVKFIDDSKEIYLFYSGLLCAFVGLFLQTKGLAVFFAIFIYLFWKHKNTFYKYFALYLLGIIVVLFPSFLIWGNNLYSNLLTISGAYVSAHRSFYSNISPLFLLIPVMLIIFRGKYNERYIDFLVVLQVCLFASTLNQMIFSHVLFNVFPSIILLVFLINDFYKKSEVKYIYNIVIVFSLLSIFYFSFSLLSFPNKNAEKIVALLKLEIKDKKIYVRPFIPGLYFELGKTNPYYSSTFETELASEDVLFKNLEILKREKPEIIFTNYDMVKKYGYKYNIIDEYIIDNYAFERHVGELSQLKICKHE